MSVPVDEAVIRHAMALARELGILRIRIGDLELWLGPPPFEPAPPANVDPAKAEAERRERNRRHLFDSSGYAPPAPETP